MQSQNIESEFKTGQLFLLFFPLVILTLMTGICSFFIFYELPLNYNIFGISSFLAATFFISTIIIIWDLEKLIIQENQLYIFTIFGKTKKIISLNEILSWTQFNVKSSRFNDSWLILYSEKEKIKINKTIYKNYEELKFELTKNKKEEIEIPKKFRFIDNNDFKMLLIFGFGGAVTMSIFSFLEYKNDLNKINTNTITDIVYTKPLMVKGHKGNKWIKFSLKNYPNNYFILNGNAYKATQRNSLLKDIEIGDTISIIVYENQLKAQLNIPYTQISSGNSVKIYGIATGKKEYLNLNNYNICKKNSTNSYRWIFGILSLILGFSLIGFHYSKPIPHF